MKKYLGTLLVLSFLAWTQMAPTPAEAQGKKGNAVEDIPLTPEDLELIAVGTVKDVPKSTQIRLVDNKVYALNNIRVPVYLDASAAQHLSDKLKGQQVGIFVSKKHIRKPVDKFGNILAHVMTSGALWAQADLISNGLAWVDGDVRNNDLVTTLSQYEQHARESSLGLWRNPENAVKTEETIGNHINSYQVYEGVIKRFRSQNGFYYFNFGDDPLKDFTLVVKGGNIPVSLPRAKTGKMDISPLLNASIRVRGWVEESDGPMMYLNYPGQLEILHTPEKDPPAKDKADKKPAEAEKLTAPAIIVE